MKKKTSLAKFVIGVLVVCVVAYAVILLSGMHYGIRNGLFNMSEQQVRNASKVTTAKFEDVLNRLKLCSDYIVGSYPVYRVNRLNSWADDLSDDALSYFGAVATVIVDVNGNQISPTRNGTLSPRGREFIKRALDGITSSDFLAVGEEIHAMHCVPLKDDGRIVGAFIVRANCTSDEVLNEIFFDTGYDVIVFADGNKRAHTTMSAVKGTRLDDSATVANVMAGNEELTTRVLSGEKTIAFYYPLKDKEGNILTMIYMGKKYKDVDAIARTIFIGVCIIALICTILEADRYYIHFCCKGCKTVEGC